MTTLIAIQARMGSTRLPGKVLRPILGRPMLSYQLERLRRVECANSLVVATTINPADEPIVQFCAAESIACIRGSEPDVLSRYYDAAVAFRAKTVIRVTSDCPLLDPDIVDRVHAEFSASAPACDLASNMIEATFPYGMAVEVMSFEALAAAHNEAEDSREREHVTPFIYWRPERFRVRSVTMSPDLSDHRWTVDTAEDLELVSRILETLYPMNAQFRMADVLTLLQENPGWEDINRHVEQRVISRRKEVR